MASTLAFSGSTNFLMNLPILLSILTYLAPSFSSSRFLSPLITKTLSSSICTLISPDFSPGMSIMNTISFSLLQLLTSLLQAIDLGEQLCVLHLQVIDFLAQPVSLAHDCPSRAPEQGAQAPYYDSYPSSLPEQTARAGCSSTLLRLLSEQTSRAGYSSTLLRLLSEQLARAELSSRVLMILAKTLAEAELPSKNPAFLSNFDFNGLGLLGLRRRQLLDGHRQHAVLTNCRNGLDVGILRQHELPHELADPPLHPHVLAFVLAFLPLPLPTDHQHVVVLHLHLDLAGLQPRHVDDEHVRIGVLLHVGGGGRHGLGVADVGLGRGVGGGLAVVVVDQVVEGVEERRIKSH
ncbi:hypothetical protein RJ640_019526 [Escallonia rubra]|uniref:Uncharacterized protein n=1 Tax=Escallonia rubra TaxID=112253 RepID=A0AA88R0Q2_9ASTE|nr:hypothetical protein RJ640_019526 [Escallonia rubra]